jgi:hypothetical protein
MWVTASTPEPIGGLEGQKSNWQSSLSIWDGTLNELANDRHVVVEMSYQHPLKA